MRGLAVYVVAALATALITLSIGTIAAGLRGRRFEIWPVLVLIVGAAVGYLVLPEIVPSSPPPPDADGFITHYDIRTRSTWVAPAVFYPLFFLTLTSGAACTAVGSFRQGHRTQGALLAAFAAACLGGGFYFTAVYLQSTWELVRAVELRDYEIVEGPVTDYKSTTGKWSESFKVGGMPFSYHEQTQLGFAHPSDRGGPIRPGIYVRIAHRGNIILRVETREEPAGQDPPSLPL